MTDAEIKKALEKAINEYAAEDVGSLKYFKLVIAILDLFNRQQADKEALIAGQETLQKALAEKIAEIERLKYNLEAVLNERADHSEAIKEALDKLKSKCGCIPQHHFTYEMVEYHIDKLIEETAGDAE